MKAKKTLTNAEIAAFCRQVSMIIHAGIPITEGLNILLSDTINTEGRELIKEIHDSCAEGNKLYTGIEKTGVFPDYVSKLIYLGEESGYTDSVLTSLAEFYEREDDVSEGIRSAITYPLIMIGMMILIIIVLIVKVLPIFKQVFLQLGAEMTPFAEKLMDAGNSLSKYAVGFSVAVVLIVIACMIVFRIPSVKEKLLRTLSKFPLTRDFFFNLATGRFASGMYLTSTSGMDVFSGLNMVKELVENEKMEERVDDVRNYILNHDTMPEALSKANVFSNLYTKMIAVGYTSGSEDVIYKQIADHYDEETSKQLRRMLAIIEPTLVIILSLIVGIILLSVLLPLMGIMSSIG